MWGAYSGSANGTLVKGDKDVPATRWWNHLYLLFFGWKTVAVLEAALPYSFLIGYRDFRGKAMLCDRVMDKKRFRVKIGREACHFFAISVQDGSEIALTEIIRTTLDDPDFQDVPLL